jgi:hypothetical protein
MCVCVFVGVGIAVGAGVAEGVRVRTFPWRCGLFVCCDGIFRVYATLKWELHSDNVRDSGIDVNIVRIHNQFFDAGGGEF